MSAPRAPADGAEAANLLSQAIGATSATPSASPAPPSWSSQPPAVPSPSHNGPSSEFTNFSATTAEILNRIRAGNSGHTAGTPAFEAKRAEVLQSYVTSDKLPTPPPIANTGRRGKGGRVGTPSQLKTEVDASPATGGTPTSARGSGRGRGRGRGRGGGRGGKRKRSESVDSDNDSDISSSYTPLPTRTKSGRSVNKPVAFVPTIPEPTVGVKRRRSTKTILASQCNVCHRGTDPTNNRIVFCDVCNTAYHQYCHDPPVDNEVVNVLEKEWLCGPCQRSKQSVVQGTEGLTAGTGLSIDDKRAYLSTLPQTRLVSLLLHATIRHPELPIFPPNVRDLISENLSNPSKPTTQPTITSKRAPPNPQPLPFNTSVASPSNGLGSAGNTPRSQHMGTDSSEMDPAEAQLLGEIDRSHHHHAPSPRRSNNNNTTTTATATATTAVSTTSHAVQLQAQTQADKYVDADPDDEYDTDPPAHYPKPGHGLARMLPPESEHLEWLVDDNFEVFSHNWRGDGSGIDPDAGLNGNGNGNGEGAPMHGVVQHGLGGGMG